jgi:hypothetical protein
MIAVENRDPIRRSRDEGVKIGWKKSHEGSSEGYIGGGRRLESLAVRRMT